MTLVTDTSSINQKALAEAFWRENKAISMVIINTSLQRLRQRQGAFKIFSGWGWWGWWWGSVLITRGC